MSVSADVPRSIVLTLPVPPSANRYWRHVVIGGHARVLVSREARIYKGAVREVRLLLGLRPLLGPVVLTVTVFRPQNRGDLGNYEKVLSDALEGVAFENDSQIVESHWFLDTDRKNPRVQVEVSTWAPSPSSTPRSTLPPK